MSKLEYKTVLLPYRPSVFDKDSKELEEMLNQLGAEGWQLSQLVTPSAVWGRSNGMIAIMARPLA
jgi:ABC-type sulfate transport system permease subunit